MKEFPKMVIVWLLFPGYGLITEEEWMAHELVFELTGKKYNYWDSKIKRKKIKDEAKKIVLLKNKFLDKYKDPDSLYKDYPNFVKIQID